MTATATRQQTIDPEQLDAEQARDRRALVQAVERARHRLAFAAINSLPKYAEWREQAIDEAARRTRYFETEPFIHEHLVPQLSAEDIDGLLELSAEPGRHPAFVNGQQVLRRALDALGQFDQRVLERAEGLERSNAIEAEHQAERQKRDAQQRKALAAKAKKLQPTLAQALEMFEALNAAAELDKDWSRARGPSSSDELPDGFEQQAEQAARIVRALE